MTVSGQIDSNHAVVEFDPAISHKAVQIRSKALSLLGCAGPFKIFVHDSRDGVDGGRNLARHSLIERRHPEIALLDIRKIDLDGDGKWRRRRNRR